MEISSAIWKAFLVEVVSRSSLTSEIDLSENLIRDFKNTSNFYDKNIEELNNHGIKILSLTIKEVLKFEKWNLKNPYFGET